MTSLNETKKRLVELEEKLRIIGEEIKVINEYDKDNFCGTLRLNKMDEIIAIETELRSLLKNL